MEAIGEADDVEFIHICQDVVPNLEEKLRKEKLTPLWVRPHENPRIALARAERVHRLIDLPLDGDKGDAWLNDMESLAAHHGIRRPNQMSGTGDTFTLDGGNNKDTRDAHDTKLDVESHKFQKYLMEMFAAQLEKMVKQETRASASTGDKATDGGVEKPDFERLRKGWAARVRQLTPEARERPRDDPGSNNPKDKKFFRMDTGDDGDNNGNGKK